MFLVNLCFSENLWRSHPVNLRHLMQQLAAQLSQLLQRQLRVQRNMQNRDPGQREQSDQAERQRAKPRGGEHAETGLVRQPRLHRSAE